MTTAAALGNILVVDDEPLNIMVLKGVLQHAGYEVISATDGEKGLAAARASRPEMILLDVMMPGESGFETCAKLKKDPATSHIPVIFVTCLGELSNRLAGLDLGAVDYITKPFIADEVVARVRSHMNFKRQQGAIIEAQAHRLGQVHAAQLALLENPENLPEARFAVQFLTVLEAGGDFYDVACFGPEATFYFVADVSGHDLAASFITSSIKALFRQHAQRESSPAAVLAAMNRILCAITGPELYLTAICLKLDRLSGSHVLSSAGHPAALACIGGLVDFLDLSGPPLGMFEDAEYDQRVGEARPGDRFYLYTDGLSENAGLYATGAAFRSHLKASAAHNAVMSLHNAVLNMVRDMTGDEPPLDDVVLLGVDV